MSTTESLLTAALDGLIDLHVLAEPVRDADDSIADFVVLLVNQTALDAWGVAREDVLGVGLLEILPGLRDAGIFGHLVTTSRTGEPTVLVEQEYASEMLGSVAYFDVRATRASGDLVSISWADVTARHLASVAADEARERYRLLAENASDVVLCTTEWALEWVSPSVEAILGWRSEQLLGSSPQYLMHPDDAAMVWSARAPRAAGPQRTEARVRCADGSYRWMDVRFNLAGSQASGQALWAVSCRDIDAEVAVRAHLRDERAMFEAIKESVTDAFATVDRFGTVIAWNGAAVDMFGYGEHEALGQSYRLFMPEMYWAVVERWLGDVDGRELREAASRTHRVRLLHRDGTTFPGEYSMAVWSRGDARHVTVILRDVTRQQTVLDNLEYSRQELAEAQRLANAGSWTYHPRIGRFEWSDELRRIYRLPVTGQTTTMEELTDPIVEAQRQRVITAIESALAGGVEADVEFDLRCADGELKRLRGRVATATDPRDGSLRVRGSAVDITGAHRAAEARVRRTARHADYLARVEHTLRTHLSVVEGWSGILEKTFDDLPPTVRDEAIGAIRRNATSLVAQVKGLMNESAFLAQADVMEVGPVDVAIVAAAVAADYRGLAEGRRLEVSPTSGVVATASAEGLDTIVRHLVENSVHHAGEGGSVEVLTRSLPGRTVEIVVRNDGAPIPEGVELFAAFAKGRSSGGNGLGLHVVSTLVEAMGGRVTGGNRTDGAGAQFVVALPAAMEAQR
ncbi:PAS domain S-box protein [Tessaracoccus sp. MC1865]|uniref:PAS domain-containing sensor histidine kinase n=1 Tax=Tessaracoccus sp. MC1865 TaxID=2760310 RepID=UPI0015FF60F1|nr:PAS domain S-box protein [Tessaracoccus sp. MC1865]MBB1482437.1 PAS domain S-box protein [Tessaracoccus sp. MC1865]QTO38106.1 PAS domain S-box protein [Tessaracoccus sp. MC1865]